MPLDLSSLRSAVAALQRALGAVERAAQTPELDEAFHETLRAGVVQCFEFTYELCWKFIQRWLRLNRSPTDATIPAPARSSSAWRPGVDSLRIPCPGSGTRRLAT